MKDYRDDILAYEDDAEDRYDHYHGDYPEDQDGEDRFDTGFDGNEDAYYEEEFDGEYDEEYEYIDFGSDYDNYSANSIGQIDPNDRTLTIVVKNTGAADQDVILFGGNQELPQHADIQVSVEESSHKEVQEESKSNPFTITGLKLSVSDQLQLDQVLHISHRSSTGSHTSRVYQPRNAASPQNLNPTMVDDSSFSCLISGSDSIKFTQKAGATSVFTLTISARANMRNVLKGRNVAEMATAPRTTGLPQLDLMRQPQPKPFGLKPQAKVVRKVSRRVPARTSAPSNRMSAKSQRMRSGAGGGRIMSRVPRMRRR